MTTVCKPKKSNNIIKISPSLTLADFSLSLMAEIAFYVHASEDDLKMLGDDYLQVNDIKKSIQRTDFNK
jgi:hypothetical protein